MVRFQSFTATLRMLLAATSCSVVLAGCGSGGGQPGVAAAPAAGICDPATTAGAANCGTVLVSLTDAEGDFTTYTVDVTSIALTRADGTSVETLPASTRIDFADLTDLAELVSAATMAPADIAGGLIRLDYSNAEIFVEAGGKIVPAQVVDDAGNPLGIVDVEIRLDSREHLIVTRGRTHLLQIDFDLSASHIVDTSTVPATATAEPFLVAEFQPVEEKELRIRGALIDVDTVNATYDIRVRPWHSRIGDHGVVTVTTLATTAFEIDGTNYEGQAGIDALALQAAGTLTVAFGTLDVSDRSFTASIVHAGDSVGGGLMTAIHGNIVARSGDQLLVKGATTVRRDRSAHFQRTVLVDIGPNTGVARTGDGTTVFDKDDLSVGQRIVAFGQLTNPAAATTDPLGPDIALILDATSGRIRMLPTHLHGTVNSFLPGQVNLALRGIDRLGIDMFDFTGTGASPAVDADPTDYEVDSATLPLASLVVDRSVRVIGYVNRFGAAPPDFSGRTVVGPAALRSALGIGWGVTGTAAPFAVMGASSLVPDLANGDIDQRHHILIGRTLVDLFDLPAAPSIEPTALRGLYGILEPGHVELFRDFSDFSNELALRLGGGANARSMAAYGGYAESANTLSANRVFVHMTSAQ